MTAHVSMAFSEDEAKEIEKMLDDACIREVRGPRSRKGVASLSNRLKQYVLQGVAVSKIDHIFPAVEEVQQTVN